MHDAFSVADSIGDLADDARLLEMVLQEITEDSNHDTPGQRRILDERSFRLWRRASEHLIDAVRELERISGGAGEVRGSSQNGAVRQ